MTPTPNDGNTYIVVDASKWCGEHVRVVDHTRVSAFLEVQLVSRPETHLIVHNCHLRLVDEAAERDEKGRAR
jgi:hypothetical protein